MKRLILTFLIFSLLTPAYASGNPSDFYFKGKQDLFWETENLVVTKIIRCSVMSHFRGEESHKAKLKIYLNGYRIKTIPLSFTESGRTLHDFEFVVKKEGRQLLEFLIVLPEGMKDASAKNNRFTVPFFAPGKAPQIPGRKVIKNVKVKKIQRIVKEGKPVIISLGEDKVLKAQQEVVVQAPPVEVTPLEKPVVENIVKSPAKRTQVEREVKITPIPKKVFEKTVEMKRNENTNSVISTIENNSMFNKQKEVYYAPITKLTEEPIVIENEDLFLSASDIKASTKLDKPAIDVFFEGPQAISLKANQVIENELFDWVLEIKSKGYGEGEVEVVVADGDRLILTQPVWIKAGKTTRVPISTSFSRPGNHRLTAMVNTNKNVIDTDMNNNIVERVVQVR